ncbi:uncharacterized protein BDR25DRAFT_80408 [Lindgomyces ingoldianus]|uniref:Uncharacterized protein n=1 Tax=Lindgomyces ingoldianus TaxID=673940 RepID=A0ACB6QFQ5_9PLEO|nr:uncharacterized protein BDR25DRAFT_80408 [Lindgomyces ingoldianus]KAF2465854.1 hypothetical protein BDR25DRAFT_80408 [Lindgomyces ingoldianus]
MPARIFTINLPGNETSIPTTSMSSSLQSSTSSISSSQSSSLTGLGSSFSSSGSSSISSSLSSGIPSSSSSSSSSSVSSSSSSSASSSSSSSSPSSSSLSTSSSLPISSNSTSLSITSIPSTTSFSSSSSSLAASNSSSLVTTNATTLSPTGCTGCVLEALYPTTLSFPKEETSLWTYTTVTQTVLTIFITFKDDGGVTSEVKTLNETKTVIGPANQTIVHTTPIFTWIPEDGITLSFDAGRTYVAFTNIWGGLDFLPTPTGAPVTAGTLPINEPALTCDNEASYLSIQPTNAEQYSSFIQTFSTNPNLPEYTAPLPPAIVEFLNNDPSIRSVFHSSNLATCTVRSTSFPPLGSNSPVESTFSPLPTFATSTGPNFQTPSPPPGTSAFFSLSVQPPESPPPGLTKTTSTYLSTILVPTESHVTRDGCLRCQTGAVPVAPTQNPPEHTDPPHPPESHGDPGVHPETQKDPNIKTPDIPGIIASILNDPHFTPSPPEKPGQSITIGDSVIQVHPAQPTQPGQQNQQSPQNPGVVIGSETLAPGQKTTINGVVISVPTNGGGSSLVVGGSTIGVNPVAPTGPPVLTVGDNTVTANSQGQFIIGSQTLTPGGPAITVGGSTLSIGPSGTIAVVNGVTQTLGNVPLITGAPVLTVNGQTIPATVVGGSTMFVLGDGQTLTAGGTLVVSGTTFSMPADGSGSRVVVNGVTRTLNNPPGLPVLTLGGQSLTASVNRGTTEFVLGPGQTLTPGGSLVVSGTTFSMPADGSGSTVVINGVTQTLKNPSGLPVLTLGGQSLTASVIGGTTEFILGPGQTLKPGGVLTVSGTTFSMPESASGSVVVVNGVTSTLGQGPITAYPALTIDGKTYSATIRDGTTEYVLGPGTTLKPGEAVTISGTTYSLDDKGTALIINGKTSTIPKTPASNSATTTGSGSRSESTSGSSGSSSSSSSSTTSQREPGNFIASGIGITSKKGDGVALRRGLDKWAEGIIISLAGWVLMFL